MKQLVKNLNKKNINNILNDPMYKDVKKMVNNLKI